MILLGVVPWYGVNTVDVVTTAPFVFYSTTNKIALFVAFFLLFRASFGLPEYSMSAVLTYLEDISHIHHLWYSAMKDFSF